MPGSQRRQRMYWSETSPSEPGKHNGLEHRDCRVDRIRHVHGRGRPPLHPGFSTTMSISMTGLAASPRDCRATACSIETIRTPFKRGDAESLQIATAIGCRKIQPQSSHSTRRPFRLASYQNLARICSGKLAQQIDFSWLCKRPFGR